jgi:single-strand DNA-binding protein
MSDVNRIYLIGHLGQDPEVRTTGSGKRVVNMTVATAYMEKTQWHRAVAWGKNADYAADYLKKGSHVYLEGRMDYREWVDKNDQKRTSAEITVDRISGLGPKERASTGRSDAPADYPETNGNVAEFDEIPF